MSVELNRVVKNKSEKNCEPLDFTTLEQQVVAIEEYALRGIEADGEWEESLSEIAAFQLDDGSFPVLVDPTMPGDARVDFICRPTYACCRALIHAKILGREVPGMSEALARGLKFCCRCGLSGHGCEARALQAEQLYAFAQCGTAIYLDEHAAECADFARFVAKSIYAYKRDIRTRRVFSAWGKDETYLLARVVDAFGCTPDQGGDEHRWMIAGAKQRMPKSRRAAKKA